MAEYVLPAYQFQVEWGGSKLAFSEVSGLTIERDVVEYRHGMDKTYSTQKFSGLVKASNVTLKRGILLKDNDFFTWFNNTQMDKPERRDMTVSLLNEKNEAIVSWKYVLAWPIKVEGPGLNASDSAVAFESIEVAVEGVTIENG